MSCRYKIRSSCRDPVPSEDDVSFFPFDVFCSSFRWVRSFPEAYACLDGSTLSASFCLLVFSPFSLYRRRSNRSIDSRFVTAPKNSHQLLPCACKSYQQISPFIVHFFSTLSINIGAIKRVSCAANYDLKLKIDIQYSSHKNKSKKNKTWKHSKHFS